MDQDPSGSSPSFDGIFLKGTELFADHSEVATNAELNRLMLQSYMDAMKDCVYFKDLKSRFLRVNEAMAQKFGVLSPSEMFGKTDFDFFTPEHAQPALDDEQNIIRTGKPLLDIEERETFEDGRVTWVSSSKMPLRDDSGRIIGTFGISHDITARKETELKLASTQKELLEASRLAGMAEISSGVLHNIGNVLNSVTTSSSLLSELLSRSRLPNLQRATQLLQEHQLDIGDYLTKDAKGRQLPHYLIQVSAALLSEREQFQKELDLLRKNVEHMKEVVSMQQNYARSSHLTEDVAPSDLVEESIRISEGSLNRHGISVLKDYQPVPKVRVARHKVLQILVNLIRNAKHAMDDSGRPDKEMAICIKVSASGSVLFIVRDNGVGIQPEHMEKLFTFGFTTRKHGHGFGLHSSVSAARELGGSLRAESAGPGQGATFTLEIPCAGIASN